MMDINKAKNVAEALKQLDLPESEKKKAIIQVAMGMPSDVVINNLINVYNSTETQKAEIENPKPELPKDYTPIERQIAEMLIENTGVHMLDSGGAYGRHWQENRKIADFRKRPVVGIATEIEPEPPQKITNYIHNEKQTTLKDFKSMEKPLQKITTKHPRVNIPLMQKAPSMLYSNASPIIKETNETVEEMEKEAKQKKQEKERLRA
ncbi:MAG: hypothetical protein QXS81_01030 [Candidatus Micrarchaeaceae archaeon]